MTKISLWAVVRIHPEVGRPGVVLAVHAVGTRNRASEGQAGVDSRVRWPGQCFPCATRVGEIPKQGAIPVTMHTV